MMWNPVLKWSLALILASAAHLLVFYLLPERTPPVLIEGGALQVQLGLDVAHVSVRSGAPDDAAQDVQSEQREDEPAQEPIPAQEPEPEPETAPSPDERSAPQALSDVLPDRSTEDTPEPEPDSSTEPEAFEPPQTAVPNQTPEAGQKDLRQGIENAADDLMQQPGVEAENPSERDSPADVQTQVETGSNQAGNSENTNYAGAVMQHLSRMRRPRASSPGSAYVHFTIAPDGSLESLSIQTSSQSLRFDREALRMIERAQPFPSPPAGVNRDFVVEIEGR